MHRLLAAAGAAAATAAALLTYATRVEPYWLQVVRAELWLRCLPTAFDGLTVLHLSDFHIRPNDPEAHLIVKRAARIPADLVCMTGDYGDIPPHAPIAAELLDAARGRLGTFAVLGNHDYDATPFRWPHRFSLDVAARVAAALESRGITVLRNEAVPITVDRQRLWVVGLDDPHTFHDDVEAAYRDVLPGEPSIALMHSWEPTDDVERRGARLVLAGHTHGGQVRPPFCGPLVHQTYRCPPRIGGCCWVGRAALHISHGLGGTHKLRFLVRPRAVLFTLRSVSSRG